MKNLKETENESKELFECFNTAFCKHLKLPKWFLDPGEKSKADEN